jgi:integrase
MSEPHGAATRVPVYSGNRRVPGLYERSLANGTTVFEARLRLGGRVRRHRLEARTKTDAIAELRALQVDVQRGEGHRSPVLAVTVEELAVDFIEHMQSRVNDPDVKRRRSQRTVDHYKDQLERHVIPTVGTTPASDLTVADVRRIIDTMARKRLSPSSRTGVLTALSSMLRFGVKAGALERNIVRDLDRDDRPGAGRISEPRYLTLPEIRSLLGAMGDTFRPLAATCAYAGLRASEALGLRWQDIGFDAHTINVSAQLGKGGNRVPLKTLASANTVPLLPALAAELRAHRQRVASQRLARVHGDAYVFSTVSGKRPTWDLSTGRFVPRELPTRRLSPRDRAR